MKRRKLVALVAAITFAFLGLLAVSAVLFVTRTQTGRDWVRDLATPLIQRGVKGGTVHVGKITGNFLTGFTVDTFAIRDKRGELFVSTGRVSVSYNPRDILDYRIYIRRASVQHPYVHIVQHNDYSWNFKEIFPSSGGPPPLKDVTRRSLGDYIVIDTTTVTDATFLLTMRWTPDDSLKGRVRDSVIKVHLETPQKAVSKTFDGYGRLYAWRNANALISHVRLADPDSDRKYGMEFRVASLSADEYEPTFKFRNVVATARKLGDSLWFQVPYFALPASNGRGQGKVWWGSDRPVRYDIAIRSDSVSLDDVNWVYPDLPRTGGGSVDLAIKNDAPPNEQIVNFKLTRMDVRSTKSHLTGDMSFGIGAPVLLVRDLNLRADPVDFDLLRTLSGKPFPVDWQGQIFATARGRGGPLTNFYVEDARGTFRDAHVPGAVSSFSGRGELNILYPAFTVFRGFDVNAGSLDLRTIEYLYPSFPRLRGFASGTARLDSSWLDVRFSNANVTLSDGTVEPSHFTGGGRITYGDPFMLYDVNLSAQPLSMGWLTQSYPAIPLRGLWSGPIRARGSSPDLELTASLQSPLGAFSFDGRVDIDSVGGYGAHGRGDFSGLNLAQIVSAPKLPVGTISGQYQVDAAGPTAADMKGAANVEIERTVIDGIRVYPSKAQLAFADGRMRIVDTLNVRTSAARILAWGAIGLPGGRGDSLLHFNAIVDSLGGLRRYLSSANEPDSTVADSLTGYVEVRGTFGGTLDKLTLTDSVRAANLFVNGASADSIVAAMSITDLLHQRRGAVSALAGGVVLGGVELDSIGGHVEVEDSTHVRFRLGARNRDVITASASGGVSSTGDERIAVVDSLAATIGESQWRMASRSTIALDTAGGIRVDSLVLRNRDSALVIVTGDVPTTGAVYGKLHALNVPLRDIGILARLRDTLSGVGAVDLSVAGTKADPRVEVATNVSNANWSGVDVTRATANAKIGLRRFLLDSLVVTRKDSVALRAVADVPVDVSLFSMRVRNDTISGSIIAPSTDLSLLKAFLPKGATVTGKLAANVKVEGLARSPLLSGNVTIADGSVYMSQTGVTVKNINGGASGVGTLAGQDSLFVRLAGETEDGKNRGVARLTGWAKNLTQRNAVPSFGFRLGASNFHAVNKRSLADLYITFSDSIRLNGDLNAPVLSGGPILVDHGAIFLADRDLARKRAVEFVPENVSLSGAQPTYAMLQRLMANLAISNVSVVLGNDVRLRSSEANVRLSGDLRVVTRTDLSTRTLASTGQLIPRLSLEGILTTEGGTYNLNLGPLQREFQVQTGGTVNFAGDPENPTLNIDALYNVKQYHERDLGVIVNLRGPLLPYPEIELKSNADYFISPTDLLSYLLIGQPGFDFTNTTGGSQVLTLLAPSLSAVAADQIRQRVPGLDVFRFELGTGNAAQAENASAFSNLNLRDYLYTSTIGAEKQVTKDLFVSVNTGLCQFESGGFTGNWLAGTGAKIEYRITDRVSVQTGVEPSTVTRTCGARQSFIGVSPTPPNYSISFSHTWRF
jgi:translocation and assembly module TamB